MVDEVKFFDLFGGIGGFRLGLKEASDKFKCVGYIDNDKFAVKSYNEIFGEEHEPKNIRELESEELPDFDILCGGFPCQSFSIAGKRKGFQDTRGTLFFEIGRIARKKLPKILLLENVKGLLNHSNGKTFRKILSSLDELGYDAEWQVLNSKYHGVPQNRERVFIIGYLRGESFGKIFPITEKDRRDIGEDGREGGLIHLSVTGAIRRDGSSKEYLDSLKKINNLGEVERLTGLYDDGDEKHQAGSVYHPFGISPLVDTSGGGHREPMIVDNKSIFWKPLKRHRTKRAKNIRNEHKEKYDEDYSYVLSSSPHFVKTFTPLDLYNDNYRKEILTLTEPHHNTIRLLEEREWKPLQKKRNEKAKKIRRKMRKEEGVDYSPMNEYKFGVKDGNIFHTVSVNPEKSHKLIDVRPVITPDFLEKDMNKKDRVGSEDGSMFTVDGTSVHGVMNRPVKLQNSNMSGRRMKNKNEEMFSIQEQGKNALTDGVRIRKLTPKECWRLQGFPDWAFEKARKVNSDTQLYRQAGNAVTVDVVELLGKKIIRLFGD